MQIKTRRDYDEQETIIFTHQYAAHSQIVDMVLQAVEDQIVTDDRAHKFDAKFVNYFKNLY